MMHLALAVCIVMLVMFSITLVLAKKNGKQSERLEALKQEIKDKERAQTITSTVNSMDINDVNERLRNISKNK